MYLIDSGYVVPNIDNLENTANKLMNEGIAIRDLTDLHSKIRFSYDDSKANIQMMYGINNPASAKQILEYFNTILDDNILSACYRDDKWTTDKTAMIELAMKGYQEGIDILTFRKADNFLKTINKLKEFMGGDKRVRPKVSLGKTNRINYSEPPLMNIPKQLLWSLIAPRKEGNILIAADIKNQEPWIMVNMLEIEELKDILKMAHKKDLYEAVFERIFDREPEQIERSELKTAWNALTYGASKFGIRKICRNSDGDKIYDYFNSIQEFKKYRNKCFGLAKKKVQTIETYFGTSVTANETNSFKLQRILMDIGIQGTGSDVLALLVEHFYDEIVSRNLQGKIELYFTRNDELILEVDKDYYTEVGFESVAEELRSILEHQIDDWEPFQLKITKLEPENIFDEDVFVEEE